VQDECGGLIPLERFMREALYHPTFGYYSSQIPDVGCRGDFSTAATLDPQLGEAIAHWIRQRAKELGWKNNGIPVIEVGAGSGLLARSVMRHLDWKTRWRIDYMICETSPILRSKQQQKLRRRGIRWIESMKEGLQRSGGRALIFSNELVDAFPCRVFQKSGDDWQEVGIIIHPDGSLSETTSSPIAPDAWLADFTGLPEGQRVERHDSYRDYLQTWSPYWKEGSLLTIDYGDLATALYAVGQRHLGGSLRAYWKHQCYSGREVYARFGKQDLTADVNFSDLIAWGYSLGWKEQAFSTQREFLNRWVSAKNIAESSNRFLIPGDAGDAFKVLEQSPGAF
jgi:SAM-dependent MidA family methyltransferase